MNKFTDFLEKKLAPIAAKIQKMKYIKILQNGFFSTIAFTTVGCLAMVLITPPIASSALSDGIIKTFILGWEGLANFLRVPCSAIYNYTVGISSIYHSFAFAYYTGKENKNNAVLSGIIGVASYMIACSITLDGSITTNYLGAGGLFACIPIAIASAEFLNFLLKKNVGSIDLGKYGVPPILSDSFKILIPSAVVLVVFSIVGTICLNTFGPLPELFSVIMSPILKFTDNIWFISICGGLMGLFWWFGIHDGVFFAALPTMQIMQLALVEAYAAGTPLNAMPYTGAQYFFWMYYLCYGALPLSILCLMSKSKQIKSVGKISIVPAIFNISEPLVFGLPMTYNPFFLIPYVLCPMVTEAIGYIFVSNGWVNQIVTRASMQIPYPFMALLGSLDVKAMILVIVLLVVDGIIYYPFLKMYERECLANEAKEQTEE